MLRKFKDNCKAVVDLGVVLMIGIAFAALMVIGYIIYELMDQLDDVDAADSTMGNISDGFGDAVGLILVAITIFILAIAISALLMLRGK